MLNMSLHRKGRCIMSVLQLIILASWFAMFFIGYKIGHRDGYIVGRKAVRKHYDSIEKVRV
jgi:hypothetical protein